MTQGKGFLVAWKRGRRLLTGEQDTILPHIGQCMLIFRLAYREIT